MPMTDEQMRPLVELAMREYLRSPNDPSATVSNFRMQCAIEAVAPLIRRAALEEALREASAEAQDMIDSRNYGCTGALNVETRIRALIDAEGSDA